MSQKPPAYLAGMYEMQAQILHLINDLAYLCDPRLEYSPNTVRRQIYKAVFELDPVKMSSK